MKILMVCLGNICRSPLAEGILQAKLPHGYTVDSCGTISMHKGEHPDNRAIKAAKYYGVDISGQRSRPITSDDFDHFDKILCMDRSVLDDVLKLAKNNEHRAKIDLFLKEGGANSETLEVPDPYWGNDEDFHAVFQMIDHAAENLATKYTSGN